jgi:GTP-binding protein
MEQFFQETKVAHCISLVDVRHNPTADDVDMINYFHTYAFPFTVVATKCDKLGKSKIKPQLKVIANHLTLTEGDIIGVSGTGSPEFGLTAAYFEHPLFIKAK